MASPGTNAGDNAGKLSRPTPPDAPLDTASPEETREVGKKYRVEEHEKASGQKPKGEGGTPMCGIDGACI